MKNRLKSKDGCSVFFDTGSFDEWCVYVTTPDRPGAYAPTDKEYFQTLKELGNKYGNYRIYEKFVKLYHQVNDTFNESILALIENLSEDLDAKDRAVFDHTFMILYFAMVAEENKKHAKLKKLVKHLGVHQVLMQRYDPVKAANFSKGMKWEAIAEECRKQGIIKGYRHDGTEVIFD